MKTRCTKTRDSAKRIRFSKISESRCLLFIMMVASSALFVRCAPVAYELQSARMTGRHQVEITPSFTKMQVVERPTEGKKPVTFPIANRTYGIQAAYGLSDNLDLRFRVVTFSSPQANKTVFSTGLKLRLVKDRVAAYFPIWFVDYRPAQFQPTLLLSFPIVGNKMEFNPSGKALLNLAGVDPMKRVMVAANLGLAISTNLSRWALRPEYSIIYEPAKKAFTGSFSIGLTFKLTKSSFR